MALLNHANIAESFDNGKAHYQMIYKAALPANVGAGAWVDFAPTSGQPKYNAYAGTQLAANQLTGVGNDGIYCGNFIAGSSKYLARWSLVVTASVAPAWFWLCDYLTFYPLVDGDDLDVQVLDNTVGLPRYTDGRGVRAFIVAASPGVAAADFVMSYTNQDGVSGHTVTGSVLTAASIGQILSCNATTANISKVAAFLPLASGDTGIRSIDSIQMLSGSGGFFNIVLVHPLAEIKALELGVTSETFFGADHLKLPEIKQGAYLNIIAMLGSSAASGVRGEMIFINS